jgi:recombination protein RecT
MSTLKEKLAEKAGKNLPAAKPKTIMDQIQSMIPQFARAMPKHMDADRLARLALTNLRQSVGLQQCSTESILGALLNAAALGLEPGLVGHAYLVPYNNRKTGRKEAQFIIGYTGMLELARRSGKILSIMAKPVYRNDHFKLVYGLDETLEHIPWHLREDDYFEDSGDFLGAYLVAKLKDGGHVINFLPKSEIEQHRSRSMAKDSGPWVTDYPAMAVKTVVRATFKWLPISIEIMREVEVRDESVRITPDELMDLDWSSTDVIDPKTGEITEGEPSLFVDESNNVA